jgi:hypothetical protein
MDLVHVQPDQVGDLCAQLRACVDGCHPDDRIVIGQGVSAAISIQRLASRDGDRRVLDAQPIRHGVADARE